MAGWKKLSDEEMEAGEFEGEFWEPAEGDAIQGTVTEDPKEGKFKKLFLVIKDDEGDEWITTQCASLHRQIKKLKIKKDDIVHLTYNGRADDEYNSHQYLLQVWRD